MRGALDGVYKAVESKNMVVGKYDEVYLDTAEARGKQRICDPRLQDPQAGADRLDQAKCSKRRCKAQRKNWAYTRQTSSP